MIRRPPRSTLDRSSAASDVYKRQYLLRLIGGDELIAEFFKGMGLDPTRLVLVVLGVVLSLIHISEPTRPY